MNRLSIILLLFAAAGGSGCQSTLGFIADTIYLNAFGVDPGKEESVMEKDERFRRETADEKWKQFWRENPHLDEQMTREYSRPIVEPLKID